ncbi:MAG: glycoside hydrolase family 32 protein [Clostridia bacterium]|nr:glycoside hydrolase family 32 protein [Clostridia bacterium]
MVRNKMMVTISHPYMVFPVRCEADAKKLLFLTDGALVYESDIALDAENPDFYAYLDVQRFEGMSLELVAEPETELSFRWADTVDRPDLYHEPYRPLYHFTERNGWLNDPNGLVKIGDTYHMFYQQNPAAPRWGNMHWGHATSPDMIHWTQHESALFPDEMGTMFSGSGIVDTEGRAGFGRGAALFFYTAAGGTSLRSKDAPFTQCLAYSVDGGKTLVKYEGNPVIPHIIGGNRDPKVIYCEELGKYVCALYLDGNTYALLTSDDFLHWTELQRIEIPGDGECPDFYPLSVENEPGVRKWVLSGASARYLVGDMIDGRFVPSQEVRAMHTGSCGYAAQTYSLEGDSRRINVVWEPVTFPGGAPFCSQMGIPVTHALRRGADGDYYLHASPIQEAKKLRGTAYVPGKACDGYRTQLRDAANELSMTVPAAGAEICLRMLGIEIVIDRAAGVVRLGEKTMPLGAVNGRYKIRMYTDTCTVTMFSETHYATFAAIADETALQLTLSGDEDVELSVWPLSHIHK